MRLLVWPSDLHLERFTAIGTPAGVAIAAWAVVIAVGVGLVGLARRIPGGFFLLAVAVLAYLPGSGVVPIYPAIADRALFTPEHFLYLPLLGLCPLVLGGLASLWPQRARRAIPAVVGALLLAWGIVVIDRNADWRDEETLFRHTIAYDPPTSRVWFNLANLALAAGRLDEAQRLYEAALARTPGDAEAHLNLGITLQRMGRLEQAEAQYRAALESDPRLAEAYRGLAQVLVTRGAIPEAVEVLRRMPTGAP
jgi:tetratricopeptide (TPR) repeat protein